MISSQAVVTAAHCIATKQGKVEHKEYYRLLFGVVNLKTLTGVEALREVTEIIIHPEYQMLPRVVEEDIAIMITKGRLQFSEAIKPICLFKSHTPIAEQLSKSFNIVGFGSSEKSKHQSHNLKYGQMTIISRRACKLRNDLYGLLSVHSAFCARAVENTVTCQGDSGGKLSS